MAEEKKPRKTKAERPGIRLQQRDLRFLAELGEVVLMDTETIGRRYFPSHGSTDDPFSNAAFRRLRLLRDHKLIEHVLVEVSYDGVGRRKHIFRLSERGAAALAAVTGSPPIRPPRSNLPGEVTLIHRLGLARLMLTVNDACRLRGLPKPEWFIDSDTLPGAALDAHPSDRFILYEHFPVTNGDALTCRPDAACRVKLPDSRPGKKGEFHDLLLYWEYDRSTMTLHRIERKLPGYAALLGTKRYAKHWPNLTPSARVRVCFVVPSNDRLEGIRNLLLGTTRADHFRFTTASQLLPSHVLSEPVWRDCENDELKAMLPPPQP